MKLVFGYPLQIAYTDFQDYQFSIISNNSFQEICCELGLSNEENIFLKKRVMETDNIFIALYIVNIAKWFTRNNGVNDVHLYTSRPQWLTMNCQDL